ncbi:hypothetical protein MelnitzEXVC044M_195 [Methylophilales phage Melnitz EXVC044M]|nr:hypothetical protein Melnitz1EXVC043M_194 [Methylophilales phage Melnitz-1 EXVC043M]QZI94699.1 hypothetical protein Melnitz2EXVC040M_195 [Methylophilales phage Melnitz-2 EXVC040M]QZI94921.1 hypothetical protein MelnitzEXVC044M_195 [Methylophilales phage Melnitz EXVC044M]QZI95142.1 hypothetical protein Melnitz3EXVC039M_195 [Methylophilales phage Melnitz-3 EXVC039M]
MSTLAVNTITAETGNTVSLASGKTLDASQGFTPPAGHVVQVVTNKSNSPSAFTTSSTSYVTSDNMPKATITPKFSNSKILIQAMIGMQHDATGQIENTIYRTTGGAATDLSGGNSYGLAFKGTGTGTFWTECNISWDDSPNTTSAVEYKWYSRAESAVSITPNHHGCSISMTLIEIAQ